MQETENQQENSQGKKKRKYVYLDKYEVYKADTDYRISILERSLNGCYVSMVVLIVWIILLTINK